VGFFTTPEVSTSIARGDDAGVYRLRDDLALIQTVDVFTPVVDEPRDYGRIAAANSLSDVYAMGGKPITCLAILAAPAKEFPNWVMRDILSGANEIAKLANAPIIGGHSLKLPEPAFGLAVTVIAHPSCIIGTEGAQPGDKLVLTKPLGSGIITTAAKNGEAPDDALEAAIEIMSHLNRNASEAMLKLTRAAATDVTGYGLLGHLWHILEASGVGARINYKAVPVLPGALKLAAKHVPGGTAMNYQFASAFTNFGALAHEEKMLICDAQTSGGLLIACAPGELPKLLGEISERGEQAWVVGEITARSETAVTIV
jgi:selenide,water dikinase